MLKVEFLKAELLKFLVKHLDVLLICHLASCGKPNA
jgi:hypothetical protein